MSEFSPALNSLLASIPDGGWVHESISSVLPSIYTPEKIVVQTECGSVWLFWRESELRGYVPQVGDRLSAFVRHPEQGDTKWQQAYVVVIGEQLVWDASN